MVAFPIHFSLVEILFAGEKTDVSVSLSPFPPHLGSLFVPFQEEISFPSVVCHEEEV